jgi:tetratricopeptide (TPR) repeat protein
MNTANPLAPFLKHVRDEMWNRFHTGKFVYERDMQNLHKFLNVAQKSGDISMIMEYHLAISGIEHELGNFQFAENSYKTLLDLAQPLDDHWRIGVIFNNLAEIHLWRRDFTNAIAHYHQAIEHMLKTDQVGETSLIISNLGMAYLAQQNYTEAQRWFDKTLERAHEDSRTHMEGLIQAYIGLADLYLQQNEFEKSLTHLKLAKEWAVGAGFTVDQLEVFFIYAKLARQSPNLLDYQAPYYYELATSTLTTPGRHYMAAKILLDEAGYYQDKKEPLAAKVLAKEAQKIFKASGLNAYAKLAQSILDTLPA